LPLYNQSGTQLKAHHLNYVIPQKAFYSSSSRSLRVAKRTDNTRLIIVLSLTLGAKLGFYGCKCLVLKSHFEFN
jgi:hypothetical protein